MKPILGRYSEIACALMRLFAWLLFAQHGAQKVFGALGGTPLWLPSLASSMLVLDRPSTG